MHLMIICTRSENNSKKVFVTRPLRLDLSTNFEVKEKHFYFPNLHESLNALLAKKSQQVNEIQKVFLIIFCVKASAVIWVTVLTK